MTSCTKKFYRDIGDSLSDQQVSPQLKCVIVIPAFAEESLIPTLTSLSNTNINTAKAEILVIINQSESVSNDHSSANILCYEELTKVDFQNLRLIVIYISEIPDKIAGVGTARKIGMDEAARRLTRAGNLKDGIIINLDADCTVSVNYFESILDYFGENPKIELVNIHFEHDLKNCQNENEKKAIINYELHLRYFIGMQKWLGLPYAFQTIGSSFAVRAKDYLSIGGMNRRKAGEDFYFIHKFAKKDTAENLSTCTVYPSSRPSFRVPFGTGKAVSALMENPLLFETYDPQSFIDLNELIYKLEDIYLKDNLDWFKMLPEPLRTYLENQNFKIIVSKLKTNSRSLIIFEKAFYQWFDAFKLMKYLHFAREHYYQDIEIAMALAKVSESLEISYNKKEVMLQQLRMAHKKSV